jgi:ABC-type transport system involved in cytochrome bd biosynthesis fused ATPase/permease subunit
MVIHPCILLFLITGVYNVWAAWKGYAALGPAGQALIGTHMLLAVIVITLMLVVLSGKEPTKPYRGLMALIVALLFLTVAMSSSLKVLRDHSPRHAGATAATDKKHHGARAGAAARPKATDRAGAGSATQIAPSPDRTP